MIRIGLPFHVKKAASLELTTVNQPFTKCFPSPSVLSRRSLTTRDLVVRQRGPVKCIGINRTQKKNCLTPQLASRLLEEIEAFEKDDNSSVGVLYGERGTFSYGIDQSDLHENGRIHEEILQTGLLQKFPLKPIVAAVNGYAIGLAFDLALWCDFRVAEDTSVMASYARNSGVPANELLVNRLVSCIGSYRALDWLLTGRPVKAKEALEVGAITRIVACGTGIARQLSCPYSPQQNGVAERFNRTILDLTRSMLIAANAPGSFWAEAASTACYVRNRCALDGGKTPEEIWTGRKPSVRHMRPFGCKAFVHIPSEIRKKLDPRSSECIMLGYSGASKGYRLWDLNKRTLVISRDVVFLEKEFPLHKVGDGEQSGHSDIRDGEAVEIPVQVEIRGGQRYERNQTRGGQRGQEQPGEDVGQDPELREADINQANSGVEEACAEEEEDTEEGVGQAVNFAHSLANMPQPTLKADRALIYSASKKFEAFELINQEWERNHKVAVEESTCGSYVTSTGDVRHKEWT